MIRVMRRVGSSLVLCAVMAVAYSAPAPAAKPAGKVRQIAPQQSSEPAIAHRPKRDEYLVVTWVSDPNADPSAGDAVTLESRRVSRSGAVVGEPVQVASFGQDTRPQETSLVHNPRRDEFLLAWRAATGPQGSPHAIYGQRLDAAGKPVGGRATLVRAEEPGQRPVTQCCGPPALALDGRGGYFVAWGTSAGFSDHAVAGRPVTAALKRGTARKLTTRQGSITSWAIAADPSGYLVASWIAGPESARGVYTDLVTRAGVRRRSTYRVHSPGGELRLARNSRTGRFALAWQEDRSIMDAEEPLRVQQLDASGRSLGPGSVVPPYKDFRRTIIESLAYNHAADEYLLGWGGVAHRTPTMVDARASLRSLRGDTARPFGPTSLTSDPFGPYTGTSTSAARWLVISAGLQGLRGQVYAPSG